MGPLAVVDDAVPAVEGLAAGSCIRDRRKADRRPVEFGLISVARGKRQNRRLLSSV